MAQSHANEELRAWDGASLVVALIEQRVAPRYKADGLAGLNQAERIVLAIFELDNEVCNGGFGQWLFHIAGDLLAITPACLQDIGADDVSAVVRRVLAPFGAEGPAVDYCERERQLFALPESANVLFRQCDLDFNALEQGMLQQLYTFARCRLAEIRRVAG